MTGHAISATIDVAVGEVRIVATDRADAVVDVRPSDSRRNADVAAAERTRVERGAGRLVVGQARTLASWAPFGAHGSVDVEIELPAGSAVTAEIGKGAIRCSGSLGDCRLKTGMGEIEVEHAAAVRLTTGLGDILVEHATGDADLATASGDVRVGTIGGSAVIKSSRGELRAREIGGTVDVRGAVGDIAIARTHDSVVAKTAKGDIRLGAARRGAIEAMTGVGAIEVAIPEGTAAWLDLVTSGTVHNALEAAGPPAPGEDQVEVRARTGRGDITIRRAA
jgi:DUF4097 and DUF4098 domain-containing protein YvlB